MSAVEPTKGTQDTKEAAALVLAAIVDLEGDEPESLPDTREALAVLVAQAERGAEVKAANEAVGLPKDAPLHALISHHRSNAALAAAFDRMATESAALAEGREGQ